MKLIYLICPLSSNECGYLSNVHNAMEQEKILRTAPFAVFNPAHDILSGLYIGGMTYDDYYNNSIAILPRCDAAYAMKGWEDSKGCTQEVKIAAGKKIPVFTDMDDLIQWDIFGTERELPKAVLP